MTYATQNTNLEATAADFALVDATTFATDLFAAVSFTDNEGNEGNEENWGTGRTTNSSFPSVPINF